MATTLRLLLGDQLNHQHPWFAEPPSEEVVYVLLELPSEQQYVRHHIQKQMLFLAAMRAFASWLADQGHRVHYQHLDDAGAYPNLTEALPALAERYQAQHVAHQLPDEWRLDQELEHLRHVLNGKGLTTEVADTHHFLTEREMLGGFFQDKKQWLMERFYRHMRQETGLLMTPDGQPVGGKWNYDAQNRKTPAPGHRFPTPPVFEQDLASIAEMLEATGHAGFGQWGHLSYPVTRAEALQLLDWFVQEALPAFGDYQDAMLQAEATLHHSLLSFPLNIKLLSPLEVCQAVAEAYNNNPERYQLNQVEGFIRQIIGWREYMRGIYWAKMPDYVATNALDAQQPLPSWYWTGETDMNCLRQCIRGSLRHGYAHHIQRLMVTGNFATLLGVAPAEINAWFLGIYVDAIEWVQLPNTHGMSQWADGGLIATKPYVSSGSYINRMSNYCKGCSYAVSKKTEANACPLNALYWHFLHRHRPTLGGNFRMKQMYATWDKMAPKQQEALLERGQWVRQNAESL